MSVKTAEALLGEARELETEAIRVGEDSTAGRELRARAAAARVEALGSRVYPVTTCAGCYVVTGWTGADGLCDACQRAAVTAAAFSDPSGGWVRMDDRSVGAAAPARSIRSRFSTRAGRAAAENREWLSRVDPGDSGPAAPERGYELEVALRDEVAAVDGSGMLLRFATRTHRFDGSKWEPLATTRVAKSATLAPAEFSAGLPVEQLAEAWGDYRGMVDSFNQAAWSRESDEREAARSAAQQREDMLRDQAHVADLLDET